MRSVQQHVHVIHVPCSASVSNTKLCGLIIKKSQCDHRLYNISRSDAVCLSDQSAVKLPHLSAPLCNPKWLLFQAWQCKNHLRDVTITVVTGSLVVEQERKQEVNAAEPQVVLSRPADPIGGCLVCCGYSE